MTVTSDQTFMSSRSGGHVGNDPQDDRSRYRSLARILEGLGESAGCCLIFFFKPMNLEGVLLYQSFHYMYISIYYDIMYMLCVEPLMANRSDKGNTPCVTQQLRFTISDVGQDRVKMQ